MKAAVFDMDGLLIDSEPLWRQAERSTYRQVGIELTDSACHETRGLRPDEGVAYWYRKFPWATLTPEEVAEQLVTAVQGLVSAQGRVLPGLFETLNMLREAGLKLGLASASPRSLIETVADKLRIRHYFSVLRSMKSMANQILPSI